MRNFEEAQWAFKPVGEQITDEQKGSIVGLEKNFMGLVEQVFNSVPEGANRTAAVRKLLEAKWTCTQAITHDWKTQKTSAA